MDIEDETTTTTTDLREQIFHNNVREQIVSITLQYKLHVMNVGGERFLFLFFYPSMYVYVRGSI